MDALRLGLDGLAFTAALILLGQSIVVVNRGSGVTNFAAAAIGVMGSYVFYDLWPGHGMPWPVAMLAAFVVAGVIGAGTHLVIMRQLKRASLITKVIATLGLMTLLIAIGDQFIDKNAVVRVVPSFLPSGHVHVVSNISVGYGQLTFIGVALGVTALLLLGQKRTRFGLATSAVCENPTVAAGMGWSPDVIAMANWALGSALATLAVILLAPASGLSVDSLSVLVVPALGAALIGQFDSLLLTLAGAVAVGIGEAEVGLVTTTPGWAEAAPLLAIVAVLMIRRPVKVDRSEGAARLPIVGSGQIGLAAAVTFAVTLVLVCVLSPAWQNALTTTVVLAVCLLSIVVLTGFAGQLSLAQFGLAGVAAFVTAWGSAAVGMPLWASMICAVLITVPIGMIVAAPALRTRGVTLAIATLSLVVVINDVLLNNPSTARWLKSGQLPPLEIFGYRFDLITHAWRYSIFALIIATLMALMVANLRRSAMGRRLLAIRANPQAASSLGISPPMAKAYAFAVAAGIAATCGALLEAQLSYAEFGQFGSQTSIQMVLQSTVGGIGFIPGAAAGSFGSPGGVGEKVIGSLISPSDWLTLITAALLLLVLLQSPDGIVPLQLRQLRMQRAMLKAGVSRFRNRSVADGPGPVFRTADLLRPADEKWNPRPKTDVFAKALLAGTVRGTRRPPSRLDVEGLTVVFGGVKAVHDVTLAVEPGEIVGLIGPNGAGKSTFIDAVTGFVGAWSGTVKLDGRKIDSLSSTRRAKRGVARSFQSLELFEDMTVGENLLAASERLGRWQALSDLVWPRKPRTNEAAAMAARDFELEPLLGYSPRALNHGKRRLLAIARAFAANPALILLDEPAAGLDTKERAELGTLIRRVSSEWNIGILLVEHDVNMVFTVCDRVVALVQGQVVASGLPDEVRHNPELIEGYLGREGDGSDSGPPIGGNAVAAVEPAAVGQEVTR